VPGDEGQGQRLISVARDVTEFKMAEQALREVRDQLEVKVLERTAELEKAHAELVGALREVVAVQETERKCISREVHDHFDGSLTALRLNLESLLRGSADQPHLRPRIESLQKMAVALDSDVSYLAWMLRPPILDELGLVPALDNFIREWSERFSVHAEFRALGVNDSLAPDVETNLYRITQEALTNTAKHANATSVNVVLRQGDDALSLVIEDNRKGFLNTGPQELSVTAGESRHGLGLAGMQERARLIGASFQIESSTTGGTSNFVSVPLQ
jgi:signal transduction histidine kinase